MSDDTQDTIEPSRLRQAALSRWDNEGGASSESPESVDTVRRVASEVPILTNAELVHLRLRVIALENLVISLLAGATEGQLEHARGMAVQIFPRPDATQLPLTIHAAEHIVDLVQRAVHFRT